MEMAVYQFKQSVFFPWMKSKIEIDDNIVKVDEMNNIFNIIPLGYIKQNIPIKHISASMVLRSYRIKSLLIGLGLIIFGISELFHVISTYKDFWALLLLPLGLVIFFNGIVSGLVIQRSGNSYHISTPFFEQKTLHKINDEINERLIQDAKNRFKSSI